MDNVMVRRREHHCHRLLIMAAADSSQAVPGVTPQHPPSFEWAMKVQNKDRGPLQQKAPTLRAPTVQKLLSMEETAATNLPPPVMFNMFMLLFTRLLAVILLNFFLIKTYNISQRACCPSLPSSLLTHLSLNNHIGCFILTVTYAQSF